MRMCVFVYVFVCVRERGEGDRMRESVCDEAVWEARND